jgi:CRISPR system Cascade subunit CasD
MSSNLTLFLDGPLQGWGYMADHAYRNTLEHPTRTGLTGLLASAMGIDRNAADEPVQIARLSGLRLTVVGIQVAPPEGRRARPVRPRRLRDFHTALRRNRDGEVVGNPDVTRRDYLCDAKFLALLEGDPGLLDELEAAVRDPRWICTLGRRSCIPASPILLGRFGSEPEALAELERRLKRQVTVTTRVEGAMPGDPGSTLIQDLPLSFKARSRGQRAIRVG